MQIKIFMNIRGSIHGHDRASICHRVFGIQETMSIKHYTAQLRQSFRIRRGCVYRSEQNLNCKSTLKSPTDKLLVFRYTDEGESPEQQ